MKIFGRRLARNPEWSSFDTLTWWTVLVVVVLEAVLTIRSFPAFLVFAAVVVHALWSGLPVDAPPDRGNTPPESRRYRDPTFPTGGADGHGGASAVRPTLASKGLMYMRAIVWTYFGLHVLAVTGGVLVFGFIAFVCGKH